MGTVMMTARALKLFPRAATLGQEFVEGAIGCTAGIEPSHYVLEPPPEIFRRNAMATAMLPSIVRNVRDGELRFARDLAESGALPCTNSAPSSIGTGVRGSRCVTPSRARGQISCLARI